MTYNILEKNDAVALNKADNHLENRVENGSILIFPSRMLLVCHYRFHEYLSKFNGGIKGTCAARLYKTEVGNDGSKMSKIEQAE